MTYQKRLTDHLAAYRETTLGVATRGVFHHKGKAIPKDHILPVELKWLNILPDVRDQVQTYLAEHPRIRLHRYFHHLNSSQAFVLNLFVPYFDNGPAASAALFRALGVSGTLGTWALEDIPVPEEETNLDVTWSLVEGSPYICEVKLSEADFGTAEQDDEHLAKLTKTYAPVLQGYVDPALLEPEAFCKYYQILRNAWHTARLPQATLIFLLPRDNRSLWRSLPEVIARFSAPLRDRVCVVAVEDVLEVLRCDREASAALQAHAEALCVKYLPGDGSVPRA